MQEQQMSPKRIYFFDEGVTDKKLLGGKGAGLCEMTSLGLRVPPGFVITTAVCEEFYRAGGVLPPGLMESVMDAMRCGVMTTPPLAIAPATIAIWSGVAFVQS